MSTATPNQRNARPGLPSVVSKSDLSDVLGVTPRHVQRLAAAGVLVRAEGGFAFAQSVRGYRDHVLETARARRGSGVEDALRETKRESIERRMAREDRGLVAKSEIVDGIDLVAGIFRDALDELAVRLARFGVAETGDVLAEIRAELDQKRAEVVSRLERGAP